MENRSRRTGSEKMWHRTRQVLTEKQQQFRRSLKSISTIKVIRTRSFIWSHTNAEWWKAPSDSIWREKELCNCFFEAVCGSEVNPLLAHFCDEAQVLVITKSWTATRAAFTGYQKYMYGALPDLQQLWDPPFSRDNKFKNIHCTTNFS
jgi:hypothetical protein